MIAGTGAMRAPGVLADKLADVMDEPVRLNGRLLETEDTAVVGNEDGAS